MILDHIATGWRLRRARFLREATSNGLPIARALYLFRQCQLHNRPAPRRVAKWAFTDREYAKARHRLPARLRCLVFWADPD